MRNDYEVNGETVVIWLQDIPRGRLKCLIDTGDLAIAEKNPWRWYGRYDDASQTYYVWSAGKFGLEHKITNLYREIMPEWNTTARSITAGCTTTFWMRPGPRRP